MKINIAFENREQYLFVRMWGPYDTPAAREAVEVIKEEAEETNRTRILIDAREVPPPRLELDRFRLGQSFAEVLSPPYKVAAVAKAAYINGFVENTAVNRGARLLVTEDEAVALEWLLGA